MTTHVANYEFYHSGFKKKRTPFAIEVATEHVFKWIDILPGDVTAQSKYTSNVIIKYSVTGSRAVTPVGVFTCLFFNVLVVSPR